MNQTLLTNVAGTENWLVRTYPEEYAVWVRLLETLHLEMEEVEEAACTL